MDLKKEDFPKKNGALERTRTFTPLGAQPPQGCVSTNSTTSAPEGRTTCKIVIGFTSGFLVYFILRFSVDWFGSLALNS